MRKTVSLIMLTLFMLPIFACLSNPRIVGAEPRTWTVDDDGPADFRTIQGAIFAASQGDIIHVKTGIYFEHLSIDKTLALVGEGPSATIIDGNFSSDVVVVKSKADYVNISSFTIRNSGPGIANGITAYSNRNNISHNIIANNTYGVVIGGQFNSVYENTVGNHSQMGIYILGQQGNNVYENSITNCSGGAIFIGYSSNNSIYRNRITKSGALSIVYSSFNNVFENTIDYCGSGVFLTGDESGGSSRNQIYRNNITNSVYDGFIFIHSSNNSVFENNIVNNTYCCSFYNASSNKFYHNNFISNKYNIQFPDSNPPPSIMNVWDDGYPSGGNYWSNHKGTDLYSGVYQNMTGPDGIGDAPYIIEKDNRDNYPFIESYVPHSPPIAIFSCSPEKSCVDEKIVFNASSSYSEKGNITSYEWNFGDGNITSVTNQTVEHAYRSVGNYTVTLNVTDTNGLWNTTSTQATVTFRTDLNKDRTVNILDITTVAKAYGSSAVDDPRTPVDETKNWNEIADLDKNGIINILDIATVARDYGKTV